MSRPAWKDSMRGRHKYPPNSPLGRQERLEYKRSKMREWSKRRYQRLKGTELGKKYYPTQRSVKYPTPVRYDMEKAWDRIYHRILVYRRGGRIRTKGIQVRCDCGALTIDWVKDDIEALMMRKKMLSLCKLHE